MWVYLPNRQLSLNLDNVTEIYWNFPIKRKDGFGEISGRKQTKWKEVHVTRCYWTQGDRPHKIGDQDVDNLEAFTDISGMEDRIILLRAIGLEDRVTLLSDL